MVSNLEHQGGSAGRIISLGCSTPTSTFPLGLLIFMMKLFNVSTNKPVDFIRVDFSTLADLGDSFPKNFFILVLVDFLLIISWLHNHLNLLYNSLLALHFLQKFFFD